MKSIVLLTLFLVLSGQLSALDTPSAGRTDLRFLEGVSDQIETLHNDQADTLTALGSYNEPIYAVPVHTPGDPTVNARYDADRIAYVSQLLGRTLIARPGIINGDPKVMLIWGFDPGIYAAGNGSGSSSALSSANSYDPTALLTLKAEFEILKARVKDLEAKNVALEDSLLKHREKIDSLQVDNAKLEEKTAGDTTHKLPASPLNDESDEGGDKKKDDEKWRPKLSGFGIAYGRTGRLGSPEKTTLSLGIDAGDGLNLWLSFGFNPQIVDDMGQFKGTVWYRIPVDFVVFDHVAPTLSLGYEDVLGKTEKGSFWQSMFWSAGLYGEVPLYKHLCMTTEIAYERGFSYGENDMFGGSLQFQLGVRLTPKSLADYFTKR